MPVRSSNVVGFVDLVPVGGKRTARRRFGDWLYNRKVSPWPCPLPGLALAVVLPSMQPPSQLNSELFSLRFLRVSRFPPSPTYTVRRPVE
jgi:hypothetical protein